jgi:hypothetical protein
MIRFVILSLLLSISGLAVAQTVENIRVEPDGDNINIHYRIGGSTDAQWYNVILECSMDGGRRFEPKTVIGDVGENIRGGKSYYTIVWDVFEDVEEVGEVEFFVKVDLVRDLSATTQPQVQPRQQPETETTRQEPVSGGTTEDPFERRAFISYVGSSGSPYGLSIGTAKNFGVYGSFRFGGYVDEWTSDIWFTAVAGVTKHAFSRSTYRLHGYAGLGTSYASYEEYVYDTSSTESNFTIDAGVINVIKWATLTLGLEYLVGDGPYVVFGVGLIL